MQIHNKVHKLICFYVLIIVDLATMGCGSSPPRADATPRIDATTEASFLKSLAEMKSSMPKPEANQLDNTVLTYISMVQWKYSPKYLERARASGVDRAGLEPTELHALLLEIYRSLHGFTASEIKLKTVAAAQETQKHNEEMSAKFEADAAKRPPIVPPKNEGVEQVWTVKGPYETVATDPGGQALFALQKQGRCDVLDPSGKITRTFDLVGFKLSRQSFARVKLCFARLAKGEESLITMSSSSNAQDEILFSRSDGTKIWSNYDSPDLFRDFGDFLVADLDGDGIDELIGNTSCFGNIAKPMDAGSPRATLMATAHRSSSACRLLREGFISTVRRMALHSAQSSRVCTQGRSERRPEKLSEYPGVTSLCYPDPAAMPL
jgi:hypothetical protein